MEKYMQGSRQRQRRGQQHQPHRANSQHGTPAQINDQHRPDHRRKLRLVKEERGNQARRKRALLPPQTNDSRHQQQ